MTRAILRSLVARKARLALTALSVVLGVAFVTGTLIYRDTTRQAFEGIFADAYQGIDVVVTGEAVVDGGAEQLFDESIVDTIAAVDGVEDVFATLQSTGVSIIVDGEPISSGTQGQLGGYLPDDPAAQLGVSIRDGRPPRGPGEVVIDTTSARQAGIELGDTAQIVTPTRSARSFTVVGTAGFGADDDLGGASLALFDLATAQDLFGSSGQIDGALVIATAGTDVADLIDRISAVVPSGADVLTGRAAADEQAAELHDSLAFIYGFLLVFALIAFFVGTFIIHNTFRIVTAQRTRELALLRALGATRRQVLGSMIAESVIVGALASGLGIATGAGLAVAIRAQLGSMGVDLPTNGTVLTTDTILIAVFAGTAVTVLSALIPAVRASRVPPLAAMQPNVAVADPKSMRLRLAFGVVATAGGGATLVLEAVNGSGPPAQRLAAVGPAALTLIVGVLALVGPLGPVLTRLIGTPWAHLPGVSGRLAQRNAGRSPRRTSATAAAITIATALIVVTNVLAASFSAAVDDVLDQGVDADFVATTEDPFSLDGFSADVADRILTLEEFESATRLQFAPASIDGTSTLIGGIDRSFTGFLTLDEVEGSTQLEPAEVLIITGPGETAPELGELVSVTFEQGATAGFRVAATASGTALTGTFISRDAFDRHAGAGTDRQVFFRLAPGVERDEAHEALASIAPAFPTVVVQSMEEFRSDAEEQIGDMVGLVTALLAMTVLISLVGVANTMALTVHERTRELGLLRALGLSQRQIRRMVTQEATIITVLGAAVGVVVGLLTSWGLISTLEDVGFTTYAVPAGVVMATVLVAAALATMFSWLPARRASRLDILAAIWS